MSSSLAGLIEELETIAESVDKTFGVLSNEQINWKQNAWSWSIGQCLEHLIITNRLEFPAIENALSTRYKNPFWSRPPFLSQIFGKSAIYIFGIKSRKKIKAPKSFRPLTSNIGMQMVRDFIAHQRDVIHMFERCRSLDLDRVKIVSPVSNLITYHLYDAFTLLTVHEQRHVEQASRVMQTRGFPS